MVKDNGHIEQTLQNKAQKHLGKGFGKAYNRLKSNGKEWNHQRVHRIYVALGLPLRRIIKCDYPLAERRH